MAHIGTTLAIYDQMTAPLNNIRSALEKTTSQFDDFQDSANNTFDDSAYREMESSLEEMASAIDYAEQSQQSLNSVMDEMGIPDAHQDYERLNNTIDETEEQLKRNNQQQEQFTNEVQKSTSAFNGLKGMAMKLGGILLSGKFFKGGMDRLMGIDSAQAKLQALGHDAVGVAVITNNALDSVTGTAFKMEEAVTTASNAVAAGVKPGEELTRYLSLTADTAAIAGSSMQEMGAIFNKVTTGNMIQMEEMNQIADRGIPIFQMLADEMGVTASEVRNLASEGAISADIFLNAVENSIGGAAQIMGEASIEAIIDNISASLGRMSAGFLNGAGDGRGFFDTVKPMLVDLLDWMRSVEGGFVVAGQIVGELFNRLVAGVSWVANAFQTYWGMIQPIIMGVVTALIAYQGALLVINTIQKINKAIATAQAIATAVKTGVTIAEAAATRDLTVAQWALNSAMLANPITWVVAGVIALIAVIYVVVAAINHFAGTSISATGIIAGAVMWLGALLWNIMIAIGNIGIWVVNLLVNAFQIGLWAIQMAFIGLGLLVVIILDLIINTGIHIINSFVYAWNLGIWAVQMVFIGLITLILLIFDGILNAGIITIELLANAWNIGVWSIQMLWIGLNVFLRNLLQGILNFGISIAESFANGWNDAIFGLQTAFYKFQEFVTSVLQAVGQGSIGVINSVLSGISSLVNTAIGGLNNLIGMANKIPGVNIDAIGTVDLQLGEGAQSFVDNIGADLQAPTRPDQVVLERSTIGDDYMNNVDVPEFPEMVQLDRSSIASDFLGSIDIPEFPQWEEVIDYQEMTNDYLDQIEIPEFPELDQTFDYFEFEDMGEWFDKGYEWGEDLANFSLTDAIKDWLDIEEFDSSEMDAAMAEYEEMLADMEEVGGVSDPGGSDSLGGSADEATGGTGKGGTSAADKAAKALDDIAGNTDAIKKNTGASKEDLAYLRDLNARRYGRNLVNNTFQFDMGGITNNVNNETDLDGVVDYIAQGLERAISMSAEGIHH